MVGSGLDPVTILTAALTFIQGPFGIILATIAFIAMLIGISRHGIGGVVIFVVVIALIFGASTVVSTLVGSSG